MLRESRDVLTAVPAASAWTLHENIENFNQGFAYLVTWTLLSPFSLSKFENISHFLHEKFGYHILETEQH